MISYVWGWVVGAVVMGALAGYVGAELLNASRSRRARLRTEGAVEGFLRRETLLRDREDLGRMTVAARLLESKGSRDPETARALQDLNMAIARLDQSVAEGAADSARKFWLGMASGALLAMIGIAFTLWTAGWS
jgi:hypothetical protein